MEARELERKEQERRAAEARKQRELPQQANPQPQRQEHPGREAEGLATRLFGAAEQPTKLMPASPAPPAAETKLPGKTETAGTTPRQPVAEPVKPPAPIVAPAFVSKPVWAPPIYRRPVFIAPAALAVIVLGYFILRPPSSRPPSATPAPPVDQTATSAPAPKPSWDSPDYAATRNGLGRVAQAERNFDQAESRFEEAYALPTKAPRAPRTITASVLFNRGNLKLSDAKRMRQTLILPIAWSLLRRAVSPGRILRP